MIVIAMAVVAWWPKSFLWYGVESVICVVRRTMRHGTLRMARSLQGITTSVATRQWRRWWGRRSARIGAWITSATARWM